jgi:predicted nucleic acid-binding protein
MALLAALAASAARKRSLALAICEVRCHCSSVYLMSKVRAAIEFSDLQRAALDEEKKLKAADRAKREKPKFDHQIVAIAKAEGATTIYSDDAQFARFAKRAGIRVIGIAELPLPPTDAQGELFLEPPSPAPASTSDGD